MTSSGKKRLLEDIEQNIYMFKVGVPGGVTVDLKLTDPGREMPFENFINLLEKQYQRQNLCIMPVNWNGHHLYLEDEDDNKLRQRIDFTNFESNKCHFLKLHDGSSEVADTYENMWDLTPDIELLRELPEEYAFETALADLIDNSLQAVWSISEHNRKFISIDVKDDRISIFDTGPGMDNSRENNIAKWGKMGASLHRSYMVQAIGGKPPYLVPNFGMFGYGGPMASMHLGRRAIVSSKSKESIKVYTLYLEREALLKNSSPEHTWKTRGSIRNPTEDEIRGSPHGSFTKVDILKLKMTNLDNFQLQCRLKDIYFPYIQCDDLSKEGKTTTPIIFQVNGVDLAEIEGGEVSITNLYSCNGPEFVFQLHFSIKVSKTGEDSGLRKCQEANARLKCAYFPIVEGQESIEKVLEKLKDEGCGITENFDTFSRVSIRRLGRLLPDARWARLPFMEFKQKKGDKGNLLKRCCSRVKCFIETDGGFIPTRPKTDLAYHSPFTNALRNFGGKMGKESEVNIKIFRDGKLLNLELLEKEFQDWIFQMHDHYDEECDSGEDDAVLVIGPNKKELRISSDVVRVHRALKRKGASWTNGQKIKVAKGACSGVHKTTLFATLEYFLIEGFQGDSGGEARIICRPIEVAEEKGCLLSTRNGNPSLEIRGSLSLPISVIDSGKCLAIERDEWERQVKKQNKGAPSVIDLLCADHCQELEIDGVFTFGRVIKAGDVPPSKVVVVVRPESYSLPRTSNILDQKYIVKNLPEIFIQVKFKRKATDCNVEHIYSVRLPASSRKGFDGLYIFQMDRLPNLFRHAGIYIFTFSLVGINCKDYQETVEVRASEVQRWQFLRENDGQPYIVRLGSTLDEMTIGCFDKYDNQIAFMSLPRVTIELKFQNDVLFQINNVKTSLSLDNMTLEVKDVLFKSNKLDKLRPSYEANLLIYPQDKLDSLSIMCKVLPGPLKHVKVRTSLEEKQFLPGSVVKDFILEMFDAYGNRVIQGLQVQLDVEGFHILDQLGLNRKVDDNGCIDLSGLLKVTAGFGKIVSVSVSSENKVVFNQGFQTGNRKLRIASEMPLSINAGSYMKNTVFEVVNSEDEVDETIHDEDNSGQSHMLVLKSDIFDYEECIRYAFKNGRCIIPLIPVPEIEGNFCLIASHCRHKELHISFNISVVEAPKVKYDELQSPCSDAKMLVSKDSTSFELNHVGKSPSLENAGDLLLSIVNLDKGFDNEIHKYGERIGKYESQLKSWNEVKADLERTLYQLHASLGNLSYRPTREEIMEQIKKRRNSAAAILCHFPRELSSQRFIREIIGVVALLGTVRENKLSRILAEYLGEDQMCALVCTFHEAVSALKKYKENGEVYYELAGKCIYGRFHVVCLEDVRVYGKIEECYDRSKKLVLPDPVMPNGVTASGFIGYAVNMVEITSSHRNTKTRAGHGLRETLFYRLFGKLQVYETREHMYKAQSCIKDDAVSLDGGILRTNGIVSFGCGNPEICFPVEMPEDEMMHFSKTNMEKKRKVESTERDLKVVNSTIMKITEKHEKSLKRFKRKHAQHINLIDNIPTFLKD